jgi:hypothetical protein
VAPPQRKTKHGRVFQTTGKLDSFTDSNSKRQRKKREGALVQDD